MTNFGPGNPRGLVGAARRSPGFPVLTLAGAAPSGDFEHQDIALLAGEDSLFAADFTASPILRHIKTGVVITQPRVVMRYPQFILGVIRVGHAESSCPLGKLSKVTVGRTLNRSRFLKALLFGGFGAMMTVTGIGSAAISPIGILMLLIGLVLLGIGAFQLWMARSLGLTVCNDGGTILHVDVERAEYQDMLTAGQLIQELMLNGSAPPADRRPLPSDRPVSAPQPPRPAPPPAPPPRPQPAPTQTPEASVRPAIWRGD